MKALTGVLVAAAIFGASSASADEIKVGVIASFTGPYADWGRRFQQGVDLFVAQHQGKAGGHQVAIIYGDDGGHTPARAKQRAQELIVRDGVQYLAGRDFTPTVFAVAGVITEAKVPFVIFNSASSEVIRKSPYFLRTGFTQWGVSVSGIEYAGKLGAKRAIVIIADYAPGVELINAVNQFLPPAGGAVVDTIKVPLGTYEFSSYLQRMQDDNPDTIFTFNPAGPMAQALVKGYIDRGFHAKGVNYWAGGGETEDQNLPNLGDNAIGIYAATNYVPNVDNPANHAFIAALHDKFGKDEIPDLATVAAYDGIALVWHMIEATNGQRDGDKAIASAKGYTWDSPRGPLEIDAKTRDATQNVYIVQVTKIDGVLQNKVLHVFPMVKDRWPDLHPEG